MRGDSLSHSERPAIRAERVPTAPFDPCFFLILDGKTLGVLYWDETPIATYDPTWAETEDPDAVSGWNFFLAEHPREHHALAIAGRSHPDAATAVSAAKERVAEYVRGLEGSPAGLEDFPAGALPWRLLRDDEQPAI